MLAMKLLECGPGALETSTYDAFSTFEWGGTGGMTHLHIILRSTMSPRLDVVAENEKARAACGMDDLLLAPEVMNQTAAYYDPYISEIHPSKPQEGVDGRVSANHPDGAHRRSESSGNGATSGLEGRLGPNHPDGAVQFAPIVPRVSCPDDGNGGRAPSKNGKKKLLAHSTSPAPSTGPCCAIFSRSQVAGRRQISIGGLRF